MGTQVIVPYRDEDEARLFKPMGDLGQIVRMVRKFTFYLPKTEIQQVDRNGISGTRTRSLSALGILTLFTISSEETMRPS